MIASQRAARPHFHHPLITIATALQYDKLARLQRDSVNFDDDQLLRLLTSSTRDTNSLFFFRGQFFQISTFGANIHYFAGRGRNDTDNYILAYADLDEKYLRRLFTGIELVAFKLCHLAVEGQRRDYHFETERLRQRVKKLKAILAVSDWDVYMESFDEIRFTRDAFAHSFIDLGEIPYRGVPLSRCFGYTKVGRSGTHDISFDGKYFIDDVEFFFEPVAKAFIERQLEQIDKNKFFRLCDQVLKKRSLAR